MSDPTHAPNLSSSLNKPEENASSEEKNIIAAETLSEEAQLKLEVIQSLLEPCDRVNTHFSIIAGWIRDNPAIAILTGF